jgi:DNA-binding IclR family transcriptional regulator
MSGLARYMNVLRLYTPARHSWTAQGMSDALRVAPSTIYRTVSDLVAAGLLEASTDAHYRLGAAFVEFDRLTRLTDPLVRGGHGILRDTVAQARIPCVGLLCRLYNGTVMCIADEATADIDFRSSYERGRPMPLTRGATSKVILARLPPRRLAALLSRNGAEQAPEDFRAILADIRKRGFAISRGEIDTGLVGLAAPVVCPPLGLIASLSLVVRASDLQPGLERGLTLLLISAASMLSETLRDLDGADAAPTRRRAAEPHGWSPMSDG